jgi:hypothetical protein
MPELHWTTILKDLVTVAGILLGGTWAAWKWGYGETLRRRREMASPDGTLTATAVRLDHNRLAITLSALWRNRGPVPVSLCATHSIVEAFRIKPTVSLGPLSLQPQSDVVVFAVAKPTWTEYIMEPNTESVMHQHFVVDEHGAYGFRWTICLSPGSLPGKHRDAHLVCTRELIWSFDNPVIE